MTVKAFRQSKGLSVPLTGEGGSIPLTGPSVPLMGGSVPPTGLVFNCSVVGRGPGASNC